MREMFGGGRRGDVPVNQGEDEEGGRVQEPTDAHALGCLRLRARGSASSRITLMVARGEQRPRLTGKR